MTNGFGLKMDFDDFEKSIIQRRVKLRSKVVMRKQGMGLGDSGSGRETLSN